jgi:hypothetical protein
MPEVENEPRPGITTTTTDSSAALAPLQPPPVLDLGTDAPAPTEFVTATLVGVPPA